MPTARKGTTARRTTTRKATPAKERRVLALYRGRPAYVPASYLEPEPTAKAAPKKKKAAAK